MIYSQLNGGDDFAVYPAAIRRALQWLKTTDVLALEAGKVQIEGADMYALVQDLTTKTEAKAEAHNKYLDLMYWPQAGERIGVAPRTGRETISEDDPEKDKIHYSAVEQENFLITAPGDFIVLFPWDIHRPGLTPGGEPVSFRKIVMKIAVSLL